MSDSDALFRISVVIGVIILIIPLLMMSMMWLTMGGMGMIGPIGASLLLGILPFLLALAIGYGGYRLVTREPTTDEAAADDTVDPVERLQERYANGELTEAELEQELERHLGSTSAPESVTEAPVDTSDQRGAELEQ